MARRRILTIDGGGIRGVFAAAVIERMEAVLGKPCREYFDCFYGTSTGAILAAGLAAGLSAHSLKEFYICKGSTVFTKIPWWHVVERNLFWTYAAEPLEAELKAVFGESSVFDMEPLLSVIAKDTSLGIPRFFNNFPDTKARHPEANALICDAIRASTAAPTYFPPSRVYVDGGISSYNNPSYAAFIGATKYLGWPTGRDHLAIFSVGTGYHPPLIPVGSLDDQNKLQMAGYVASELMDDINLLQNQLMKRMHEDFDLCWYRRYTIRFDQQSFDQFEIDTTGVDFEALSQLDGVEYVHELASIGERVGAKLVDPAEFGD
jgi:predicted acylesterase/phospholipase RssA